MTPASDAGIPTESTIELSSILKSLKKIESETDRSLLSKETPALHSRLTLRRRITSYRRIRLWVLGVITAGGIAAGGWFFMRARPVQTLSVPPASSAPVVVKPEKNSQKASPPLTSSPRKPQPGLPASQPPAAPPFPGEAQATGAQSPTSLIKQAIASRSKGAPPRRAKAELPARSEIPDENAMETREITDPPPSPFPPPQAKLPFSPAKSPPSGTKLPAAGADGTEPAPLSAEAGLKLEALAWALAPESRFAVINSQIVREGDSVGGAKVERIEKEQVVLRKEGKLWQIRHRPQR